MPRILLTVPETYESVTRPVVYDITRKIFEETGLPLDTLIHYPSDLTVGQQLGSSINKEGKDVTKFNYTTQVAVEVDENYEQDRLHSTAVQRAENLLIFNDEKLGVEIKPIYASAELVINFKFRAIDKVLATRWRDDIRNRVSAERAERVHDIKYHYLIPEEMIHTLKEVHKMREVVEPYGDDWLTYFGDHRTTRTTEITTLKGTEARWAIAETQMRIMGWFEFEGIPEQGGKDDEASTWTIGFSYKLRYDKPIACAMLYPMMIHNQLVSDTYRPRASELPYKVEQHQRSYALSALYLGYFEANNNPLYTRVNPGISIPEFDDFVPQTVMNDTMRVFTALVSLDDSDPQLLMNLNELGKFQFEPGLLHCLKNESPWMTKPYQSIFMLSIYCGNQLMDPKYIRVDSNLNVYSTVKLSKRLYYHLRFSVVKRLSLLPPVTKERLRRCGACLIKVINAIDPTLADQNKLPPLIGGSTIPKKDLDNVSDELDVDIISKGNMQEYQFNTVMSFFIESYKNAIS